jgi:hypothetical protein
VRTDQETGRFFVNAIISQKDMQESDLLAFHEVVASLHPGRDGFTVCVASAGPTESSRAVSSERAGVLSLSRMDDLSSHSERVSRALCRRGATVMTVRTPS